MRTYFLNSKKCSTLNSFSLLNLGLVSAWILTTAVLQSPAYAAIPKAAAPKRADPIFNFIQKDLSERSSLSFDHLLSGWQAKYGSKAVPALIKLASDRTQKDPDRYIALMAGARLGGSSMKSAVSPFLKDQSWMIRSAAIRVLSAFYNSEEKDSSDLSELKNQMFNSLKDPALVVRTEAVEAIDRLKLPGSGDALLNSLEDSSNYHKGVAQWVPQRALWALVRLPAESSQQAQSRSEKLQAIAQRDFLKRDAAFKKQLASAAAAIRKSAPTLSH